MVRPRKRERKRLLLDWDVRQGLGNRRFIHLGSGGTTIKRVADASGLM